MTSLGLYVILSYLYGHLDVYRVVVRPPQWWPGWSHGHPYDGLSNRVCSPLAFSLSFLLCGMYSIRHMFFDRPSYPSGAYIIKSVIQ
jgi:hypothetical protein